LWKILAFFFFFLGNLAFLEFFGIFWIFGFFFGFFDIFLILGFFGKVWIFWNFLAFLEKFRFFLVILEKKLDRVGSEKPRT
jgi:hypothetical protein